MTLRYDPPSEGYTTSIPPGTKALREGVAAFFGITRHEVIRDKSRCNHQASEHCVCRGVDWYTRDIPKGTEMRKFLIWAGDRLGIQAAIFNNIVWGYGTWRERSPASSPHKDHVHGGFTKWAAKNVTRAMVDAALAEWSGTGQGEDELTPDEKKQLAQVTKDVAELKAVLLGPPKWSSKTMIGAILKALVGRRKNPDTGVMEDYEELAVVVKDVAAIRKAVEGP